MPAPEDQAPDNRPADDPARIRLVVLFGGQSAEHEISRVSARHLLAAVDPDRYEIAPVAITKSGQWVLAEDAARALAQGPAALGDALPTTGRATEPAPALAATDPRQTTVVFPLLHGPLGEDGTVQGLLELAGVPFVGCGVLSSALAMDKIKAKEQFAAAGIPQAAWIGFHERRIDEEGPEAVARALADQLTFPLFVKPANMGSSIGVSKAHDHDEVVEALTRARRYDEWLVVEEGIDGREIECAVLGNLDPRASVPGEITPAADFYDFADKYEDGAATLTIPADLDPATTRELQELAVRAFRSLRCEGLARVDFFYEPGGRGLLVNEINTMPGFTPISMYPRMWQASGLPYARLIDELVALALERHQRRAAKHQVD
jgi:D-alanine-D-alanine ligase